MVSLTKSSILADTCSKTVSPDNWRAFDPNVIEMQNKIWSVLKLKQRIAGGIKIESLKTKELSLWYYSC